MRSLVLADEHEGLQARQANINKLKLKSPTGGRQFPTINHHSNNHTQ